MCGWGWGLLNSAFCVYVGGVDNDDDSGDDDGSGCYCELL